MSQTFQGRTEDAEAPFFTWEVGSTLTGKISKVFSLKTEGKEIRCYQVDLDDAVEVDGEEWDRVSFSERSGIQMAMQASKPPLSAFRIGDTVRIECTGKKPAKKEGYSARLNFQLSVVRA